MLEVGSDKKTQTLSLFVFKYFGGICFLFQANWSLINKTQENDQNMIAERHWFHW